MIFMASLLPSGADFRTELALELVLVKVYRKDPCEVDAWNRQDAGATKNSGPARQ
jgi:hypothetical protein